MGLETWYEWDEISLSVVMTDDLACEQLHTNMRFRYINLNAYC